MRKNHQNLCASLAIGMASALVLPVQAGVYADDLAKCLVRSTIAQDRSGLVQWMFSMMALHPQVLLIAAVSDAQRTQLSRTTATLFQNLLTKAWVSEARQAMQYEGPGTIETSFGVLGQVASRDIFSNPAVVAGMAEMGKFVDEKRLNDALKATP